MNGATGNASESSGDAAWEDAAEAMPFDDVYEPEPADAAMGRSGVPLCDRCMKPVSPLDHLCPHCGRAVGKMTPYLPFESIAFDMQGVGRMSDKMKLVSTKKAGPQLLQALLYVFMFTPMLVIGLLDWAVGGLRKWLSKATEENG